MFKKLSSLTLASFLLFPILNTDAATDDNIYSKNTIQSLSTNNKTKANQPTSNAKNKNYNNRNTMINKTPPKQVKEPVIYITPHADDETLTYAVDILNERRKGRPIILSLVSSGEDSFSREMLNGRVDHESHPKFSDQIGEEIYCAWHGMVHNHATEQYLDGYLTRQKFSKLRIDEFHRAAEGMGIPKNFVNYDNLSTQTISKENVKQIIMKYKKQYPTAEFRTMSKYDYHYEHRMLGEALEELENEGLIEKEKTRYFLSNYTYRFDHTLESRIGIEAYARLKDGMKVERLTSSSDAVYLTNSISAYEAYVPSLGYYATGYHSVVSQFKSLKGDMSTVYYD
ncbi:PIG-L family deacetylase [Peribacillus alkalitolerans]|uniref:PIG-L family deacetylase n=1 Tax=Peribacillus alkalitolerans TaxID=1550385 RepID=UPI0013D4434E|nr:PIG-L family deacetylase [Peribacillus alkalitolerans]